MRALLLLAMLGCQVEAYDASSTKRVEDFTTSVNAAQDRMHARYTAARSIELALAHGNLEQAKAYTHVIAQLDEPDALPAWQPYVIGIRNAARQIEITDDIVAAARQTGTLGMRCAQCHVAMRARVTFATPLAESTRPAPRMDDHQWAAARMWEGLIGPSEERWLAGARSLETVPINLIAQAKTRTYDDDIDDVARLRMYARRALITPTSDGRADVFGAMLATCAHCHALLRDR